MRDFRKQYIIKGSQREWREQRRMSMARHPAQLRGAGRERSRTKAEIDVIHALRRSETGDEDCCDERCFNRLARGVVRGLGTLAYVLSVGLVCTKYGHDQQYEDTLDTVLKGLRDHEETYEVGRSFKEMIVRRKRERERERWIIEGLARQLTAWRRRAKTNAETKRSLNGLAELY